MANIGIEIKTKTRIIKYYETVINKHNITTTGAALLKDKTVLNKTFNNFEDINYCVMAKKAVQLGIISDAGFGYIPKVVPKYYNINFNKLKELAKEIGVKIVLPYSKSGKTIKNYSKKQIKEFIKQINKNNNELYKNISYNNCFNYNNIYSLFHIVNHFEYNEDLFRPYKRSILSKFNKNDIESILNIRYPQLSYYQNIVNELNNNILSYTNKIKFEPHINSNKISIRATQYLAQLPLYSNNYKHKEKISYNNSREHKLDKIFGKNNWAEYDVSCSVARILHLITSGEWLAQDIDLYYIIFNSLNMTLLGGTEQWSVTNRDIAKKLFMIFIFGGGADDILHSIKYNYNIAETQELKQFINTTLKLINEFCGITNNKNTTAFLHESCVYIDVMKTLTEMGVQVIQVYDCFYMTKNILNNINMDKIVEQCAKNYYNMFIK